MSKEAFEAAIGKTIVEAEFRDLLLADPDQALAGFDLTEEEVSILKKIDSETLELLSSTLDTCIRTLPTIRRGDH
jgi:hypothetical protein